MSTTRILPTAPTAAQMLQMRRLLGAFVALTLASVWVAFASEIWAIMVIPAMVLVVYVALVDFRALFFLLLIFIPLSVEIDLPGGFGTDLPTEPLIVGLMLVYFFYAAQKISTGKAEVNNAIRTHRIAFARHPITLLLLLHLSWIFVTMLHSESVIISLKFFLAKVWYVATFYFLAAVLLRTERDMSRMFWCVFVPLSLTVVVSLARHAMEGFSYVMVNKVVLPYFRNHVNYACTLALFVPYIVWAYLKAPRGSSERLWLVVFLGVFFVGIWFSFTRTAYVAVVGAMGFYFVIRWRLTRYVLVAALLGLGVWVNYISSQNKFMEFAPKFERAITQTKFSNLVEATYKLEDISTMERVYRWVAGFHMVARHPYMGFGPGCFYSYYRSFAVTSFKTYVSDNPEHSGIHSYYLMTTVEQGLPGLFFLLLLCFGVLLKGEQIYHAMPDPRRRMQVMTVLLSTVVILMLIIINDLLETDKIGSFFFLNLALLVNLDIDQSHSPT